MRSANVMRRAMMLLPLALLASGCAHRSATLPCPSPPEIPALPEAARQPPRPSICSPSCSSALTKERTDLLDMLTKQP